MELQKFMAKFIYNVMFIFYLLIMGTLCDYNGIVEFVIVAGIIGNMFIWIH